MLYKVNILIYLFIFVSINRLCVLYAKTIILFVCVKNKTAVYALYFENIARYVNICSSVVIPCYS